MEICGGICPQYVVSSVCVHLHINHHHDTTPRYTCQPPEVVHRVDGPASIHGPPALANMYISRHQNPPAFSQHFPVWKLAPFRDPPQLVSVNTLSSHFCNLLLEWEGRGLREGEKERERGRLPNGKLISSFLTFTEPLSTCRELSYFFHKGPCSPQRPAAVLRGFPHYPHPHR